MNIPGVSQPTGVGGNTAATASQATDADGIPVPPAMGLPQIISTSDGATEVIEEGPLDGNIGTVLGNPIQVPTLVPLIVPTLVETDGSEMPVTPTAAAETTEAAITNPTLSLIQQTVTMTTFLQVDGTRSQEGTAMLIPPTSALQPSGTNTSPSSIDNSLTAFATAFPQPLPSILSSVADLASPISEGLITTASTASIIATTFEPTLTASNVSPSGATSAQGGAVTLTPTSTPIPRPTSPRSETGTRPSTPATSTSTLSGRDGTVPKTTNTDHSSTTSGAPASPASATSTTRGPDPVSVATHSPPFYVAIVLGTIFVVTCIAAFVAWFLRLRSHARRRKQEDEIVASVFSWSTPRMDHNHGYAAWNDQERLSPRYTGEGRYSSSFSALEDGYRRRAAPLGRIDEVSEGTNGSHASRDNRHGRLGDILGPIASPQNINGALLEFVKAYY